MPAALWSRRRFEEGLGDSAEDLLRGSRRGIADGGRDHESRHPLLCTDRAKRRLSKGLGCRDVVGRAMNGKGWDGGVAHVRGRAPQRVAQECRGHQWRGHLPESKPATGSYLAQLSGEPPIARASAVTMGRGSCEHCRLLPHSVAGNQRGAIPQRARFSLRQRHDYCEGCGCGPVVMLLS